MCNKEKRINERFSAKILPRSQTKQLYKKLLLRLLISKPSMTLVRGYCHGRGPLLNSLYWQIFPIYLQIISPQNLATRLGKLLNFGTIVAAAYIQYTFSHKLRKTHLVRLVDYVYAATM